MAARARTSWLPRRRWTRVLLAAVALPVFVASGMAGYYYGRLSLVVQARLAGERVRVIPRVYGRPLTLRVGQTLSDVEVAQRLNDLGYAERERAAGAGEFSQRPGAIALVPRSGDFAGQVLRAEWAAPPPAAAGQTPRRPPRPPRIERLFAGDRALSEVSLDPPLLSALVTTSRERRRRVPLAAIPPHVQQAVLAIEDRRFYAHPGIDPIRIVGALITNLRGTRSYLVGASTITQQLARNFFLSDEMALEAQSGQRSIRRKLLEQFMAVVLEVQAIEGRDPRALSERGLSRPPRIVRAARRRRSGADLLRQGPQQPEPRRGRAHRRRHPVARQSLAVRRCRPRQGPPRRRAAGDGRRRLHQRRRRRPRRARPGAGGGARARLRGAVLRRLRRPAARRRVSRAGPARRPARGLHDPRPQPAARRAGCGAHRSGRRGRDAGQAPPPGAAAGGAGGHRPAQRRSAGPGRRPLLQPVAVQPRHQRPAPARLGVQAVRLPGGVRSGGHARPHRHHPGDAAARRTDHLAAARRRLVAGQLRRRVRRR